MPPLISTDSWHWLTGWHLPTEPKARVGQGVQHQRPGKAGPLVDRAGHYRLDRLDRRGGAVDAVPGAIGSLWTSSTAKLSMRHGGIVDHDPPVGDVGAAENPARPGNDGRASTDWVDPQRVF